jgi:hypothetical protein
MGLHLPGRSNFLLTLVPPRPRPVCGRFFRINDLGQHPLALPGRLARRWNCDSLDLIAAGLRRDAAAVF